MQITFPTLQARVLQSTHSWKNLKLRAKAVEGRICKNQDHPHIEATGDNCDVR